MERTQLFIELLNDLHQKINSNNEYQILKSAEIMRSLLFDASGALVDKVNREFLLKIVFEHEDTRNEFDKPFSKDASYVIPGDSFYPKFARISKNYSVKKSSKDQLLKTPILISNGKEFTVKELLHYALYKMGGTHHEDPKTDADIMIENVTKLPFFNFNLIIFQIRSIGFVVETGLQEIKNEVIKKYYR